MDEKNNTTTFAAPDLPLIYLKVAQNTCGFCFTPLSLFIAMTASFIEQLNLSSTRIFAESLQQAQSNPYMEGTVNFDPRAISKA